MSTLSPITHPGASPFDALRHVRDDGTEYWSAREVQPVMGYTAWRNFEVPLRRAMQAASNQGVDVTSHFAGSRNPVASGTGGDHWQADYHLSRFAAYLVAMNGDPNKPEVAAAQGYFAVRTRQAEVALPTPQTREQRIAAALIESQQVITEQEERIAVLEPSARAWHVLAQASGDLSLRGAAQVLSRDPAIETGQNRLAATLREIGWVDRNGEPYQKAIDAGYVKRRVLTYDHPRTGRPTSTTQVRITAKGLAWLHRYLGGVAALRTGEPMLEVTS